jgi:hypothetical protein
VSPVFCHVDLFRWEDENPSSVWRSALLRGTSTAILTLLCRWPVALFAHLTVAIRGRVGKGELASSSKLFHISRVVPLSGQ